MMAIEKINSEWVDTGTRKRYDSEALAGAAIITEGLNTIEGVLKELLRAAAVSPLISIPVVLIIANILYQHKIIDQDTSVAITVFVAALTAGDIIGELIGGGVFKSSAQTLVYGADQLNMTSALMGGLSGSKS